MPISNFSTMILAAGFGKRMKDLAENKPKPLLEIKNTTLLSNAINFFYRLDCKKFIINSHYLYEQLNDYIIKNHKNKNITLIYEKEILDTGGAIKNAVKYFENKNFLVSNVDIFWNNKNSTDIENFINTINHVDFCSLLLAKNENTFGLDKNIGDFVIENNYLRRWKINDPIFFYTGLQILNPIVFNNYKEKKFSINKVWDNLIFKKKITGKIMKSNLLHIGNKDTYNKFTNNFLD